VAKLSRILTDIKFDNITLRFAHFRITVPKGNNKLAITAVKQLFGKSNVLLLNSHSGCPMFYLSDAVKAAETLTNIKCHHCNKDNHFILFFEEC